MCRCVTKQLRLRIYSVMKVTTAAVSLLVLVASLGCRSTGLSVSQTYEARWRKGVLAHGVDPKLVVYPFEATPQMLEWAKQVDPPASGDLVRLARLQRALFDTGEFQFIYDGNITATAADAFETRRGNCLSFTSLFIALSRGLGMKTSLVTVQRKVEVTHEEDLVVVSRHVVAGYSLAGELYLYDFYVASDEPYIRRRVVDDVTASALYHTNIGSLALKRGDYLGALSNLDLAARLAPGIGAVWVNLGVARRRLGDLTGAARAYERALKNDPGDPSALTNLAYLYRLQGHEAEAKAALQAASKGPSSPFTLIALAGVEEVQGHLKEARHHLLRAKRGYRHVPEVWDALARFASRRGELKRAARYRKKAEKLREKAVASNS